jgi:hypothetical protein
MMRRPAKTKGRATRLERDGGFATQDAEKIAGRTRAEKIKNS